MRENETLWVKIDLEVFGSDKDLYYAQIKQRILDRVRESLEGLQNPPTVVFEPIDHVVGLLSMNGPSDYLVEAEFGDDPTKLNWTNKI